jgi:hypothetical protein
MHYVKDLCKDEAVIHIYFLFLLEFGGGKNRGILAKTL